MIERFVLETIWLYEILAQYNWIIKVIWASLTITSLVLFLYHLQSYYEIDFFMENVDVLGDFSMASYKIFMIIFAVVPILSATVIIWSTLERLDSRKFLKRFGCP